jgi:hypothetical protein
MTAVSIGALVFGSLFAGAFAGMFIRQRLPDKHLTPETENVVKLGMGVIATIGALVISLLLGSAKTSFDVKDSELKMFAADLILLDRQLVHLGVDGTEARGLLRRYTRHQIAATWPDERTQPMDEKNGTLLLEDVQVRLRALTPRDDAQRSLQSRALQISGDLAQTRWLLREQTGSALPTAFLLILVFWLTVIFGSFGLFAPWNPIALASLMVCSLSVSGAIFLIEEMAHPFGGLVHISSAPMHDALALLEE